MIKIIKTKDRLILASIAGIIAAIISETILHFLNLLLSYMFEMQYINMPLLALELFLNVYPLSTHKIILGILTSFSMGGMYALLYLYTLDLTGWRYLWLKSIIVIVGSWFFFSAGLMSLLDIGQIYRDEPVSIAIFYFTHFIFATCLYFIIKLLGVNKSRH
ncbi:MAG: hypothetical protein APF84_11425 [Gracilibacter sp. BRH_c7a]|nr:MAG: hypothetical protein APF84_11425 [Gracilibacter sp. BRH_c7a]